MCSAMYVVWETDGPVQNGKKFTSCGAWQLGVFIFPLMLTLLLFLSKNFLFMVPKIGKYVLVFYGVFLRTIMVLGMLVMPIYGFLYAFYHMFRTKPEFESLYRSIYKTITMLFGEFE